jgi:hypothetical protein
MFADPQYKASVLSPFWRLELWSVSYIFGKPVPCYIKWSWDYIKTCHHFWSVARCQSSDGRFAFSIASCQFLINLHPSPSSVFRARSFDSGRLTETHFLPNNIFSEMASAQLCFWQISTVYWLAFLLRSQKSELLFSLSLPRKVSESYFQWSHIFSEFIRDR